MDEPGVTEHIIIFLLYIHMYIYTIRLNGYRNQLAMVLFQCMVIYGGMLISNTYITSSGKLKGER